MSIQTGWRTPDPNEPLPPKRPIDATSTREAWKAKYDAIYHQDRDGMDRVEDFLFDMEVLPTPANLVKVYEFLETLDNRQPAQGAK